MIGSRDSAIYEIRIRGHLAANWSEWFGGFEIENTSEGDTLLTGAVVDQTALHSVLQRIRDLGLTLVYVKQLDPED